LTESEHNLGGGPEKNERTRAASRGSMGATWEIIEGGAADRKRDVLYPTACDKRGTRVIGIHPESSNYAQGRKENAQLSKTSAPGKEGTRQNPCSLAQIKKGWGIVVGVVQASLAGLPLASSPRKGNFG